MKRITVLFLVLILLVPCLSACASASPEQYGLPGYDADCVAVSETEFELWNITKTDFLAYVELLKEDGFTFEPPTSGGSTEEIALSRDYWQGRKDNVFVVVFLMLDLKTDGNYILVNRHVK